MKDEFVIDYQENGRSEQLISQYQNFLNKYHLLLEHGVINMSNYDIRYFLSCFITDGKLRGSLRRGRYHGAEVMSAAYRVVKYLQNKLKKYNSQEIMHELIIPFLHCAKEYKHIGVGFDKYLYKTYKYELKRHFEKIKQDVMDTDKIVYKDVAIDDEWEEDVQEEFVIEMDELFELSDPRWIHGNKSQEPFCHMKSHERYILVKYYVENNTDKEIARMLPYNPKSIHRIRMRLVDELKDMYEKGNIKCLRL